MFLECRTIRITIPKSNEVSFVFPFNQCSCKFKRNNFDATQIDPERYTKTEINKVLDSIERSCGQFKTMKKCTILAVFSVLIFIILIVVGNVLLNIGLAKYSETGEIEFAKFRAHGLVIAGASSLFLGIVQIIISTILIATKMRKLRLSYEVIATEIIHKENHELKSSGLRWKLGQCFNWIELSLDYKIYNILGKQSLLDPVRKIKSRDNSNIPLTLI